MEIALKQLEHFERLERLERPVGFRGITHSARVEKGIRKILKGRSVPLDTCLLMGDPKPLCPRKTYCGAGHHAAAIDILTAEHEGGA
jgi:hypothetical protein